MTTPEQIARLKAQRDAITAEIKLIEDGVKKSTYDACMAHQLITINEHRMREGKRQISKAEFQSGILYEGPEE